MVTIEVDFYVGQPVMVTPVNEKGVVTGITVFDAHQEYQVVYWTNGTRHSSWLRNWEIISG